MMWPAKWGRSTTAPGARPTRRCATPRSGRSGSSTPSGTPPSTRSVTRGPRRAKTRRCDSADYRNLGRGAFRPARLGHKARTRAATREARPHGGSVMTARRALIAFAIIASLSVVLILLRFDVQPIGHNRIVHTDRLTGRVTICDETGCVSPKPIEFTRPVGEASKAHVNPLIEEWDREQASKSGAGRSEEHTSELQSLMRIS